MRSVGLVGRVIESARITGESRSEVNSSMLRMLQRELVLPVRFYFLLLIFLSFLILFTLIGIQDAVNSFATSRAAYDNLETVVSQALKALSDAHTRLGEDFVALRNSVPDPSVFIQVLLDRDPEMEITYDLLSYYATLFNWDSSLNFRSVIEGHTSVAAWLSLNKVPIVVEEPFRGASSPAKKPHR